MWNDGPLPIEFTVEKLLEQHASYPRNPLIADACFKTGYIDTWGRGISKVTESCEAAGLPKPIFEEANGGMRVTLFAAGAQSGVESGVESGAQSERILFALRDSPLSAKEIALILSIESKSGALKRSIKQVLEDGLIEYTIPEKPPSRLQKYRLTEKGRQRISESN